MGAAGFIAPRHLKAVRDVGGELVAAYDPCDSVGILDSYFDECLFSTDSGAFWRACKDREADWVILCTPNYIHSTQAVEAMRSGYDVICEKPLCISDGCLRTIKAVEEQTEQRTFAIQQLRLHPHIKELKACVRGKRHYDVNLEFITRRGPWYWNSWKANFSTSGGLLMNIGVHFFDALIWIFGPVQDFTAQLECHKTASGTLDLKHALVDWKLSVDKGQLPPDLDKPTWKKLCVTHHNKIVAECDLSTGFENLHTESYRRILAGDGFRVDDVRPAVELIHEMNGVLYGER
jgi:UDP-N-acetyl-2-amino-2-deoxyglucuronate dehydrogenase